MDDDELIKKIVLTVVLITFISVIAILQFTKPALAFFTVIGLMFVLPIVAALVAIWRS